MKNLAIFMVVALFSATASASTLNESESAVSSTQDTLKMVKPDSVLLITENNDVKVRIYGDGENKRPDYRYAMDFKTNEGEPVVVKESKGEDWLEDGTIMPFFKSDAKAEPKHGTFEMGIYGALLWGFNFAQGAPSDIDISAVSSYDIWWPNMISFKYRPANSNFRFRLDWGMEWSNYRMTDNNRFVMDDNSIINVEKYPDGVNPKFSRIKVLSYTWSLTAKYKFAKKASLRLGPVFAMHSGLSVKTKYKDANGATVKDKVDNPKVNPFSVDWLCDLQYDDFGFFFKYSPKNVLKSGYGPEFSHFTLGVSIGW